jgi:hypothetical protein
MRVHALPLALLVVLVGGCGTFTTTDRYHARDGNRVYGANEPAQGHELVCHKGKKTLSLPASAVQAHLGHGDHRGPC